MGSYLKSGFSLVEVLIFTAILAVFFVVASEVATTSLRNMQTTEHKILATRYAQELESWLQSQRENDWNGFVFTHIDPNCGTGPHSQDWCFNNPISSGFGGASMGACSQFNGIVGTSPSIFKRRASLSCINNGTQVDVTVEVQWQEIGGVIPNPVQLKTRYSIWEQ